MVDINKLKTRNAENIQKIAKTKELEDKINQVEAQVEKNSINATRSIAYINQTSSGGSKASGKTKKTGKDDTNIDTDKNGKVNSEDQKAKEDTEDGKGTNAWQGGGSGGMNAQDDGKIDVEDLLNPDEITQQQKDLGLTLDGKGQLKALTGIYDCNTAADIEIRVNQPIKPPTGWHDADTPIEITGNYEAGKVWSFAGLGYDLSFTAAIAPGNLISSSAKFVSVEDNGGSTATWLVTSLAPSPGDYLWLTNDPDPQIGDALGSIGGTGYSFNSYVTGVAISSGYGQQDCGIESGSTAACAAPAPDPVYESWIEGIPGQLAYNNGQFTAAQLDPNINNKFKLNRKSINNFCFGTDRHGRMEPTNDGGFMIMETEGYNGGAIGLIRTFNAKGELTGYADTTQYTFLKA